METMSFARLSLNFVLNIPLYTQGDNEWLVSCKYFKV